MPGAILMDIAKALRNIRSVFFLYRETEDFRYRTKENLISGYTRGPDEGKKKETKCDAMGRLIRKSLHVSHFSV